MFSLYARIAVFAVILTALAASHWKAYHLGGQAEALACAQEREAARAAAQAQADANRARARVAEVRTVQQERVRVETVREIVTEVRNETQNLAACRLDAGDVRMLNDAARRIGEAGAAAGAADAGLPAPRPADQ